MWLCPAFRWWWTPLTPPSSTPPSRSARCTARRCEAGRGPPGRPLQNCQPQHVGPQPAPACSYSYFIRLIALRLPKPALAPQEAEQLASEKGWAIAADGDKFRRVVPSPNPESIVEARAIELLLANDVVAICCGGAGVGWGGRVAGVCVWRGQRCVFVWGLYTGRGVARRQAAQLQIQVAGEGPSAAGRASRGHSAQAQQADPAAPHLTGPKLLRTCTTW